MADTASRTDSSPQAGIPQGVLLILIGFLPMMAIISLAPTLPTLMQHFGNVPHASVLVPMLLTAPSLCILLLAPLAGVITDRYGRRKLLLASLALYGFAGILPFLADSFTVVLVGRLIIGVAEAGILTTSTALMADYFAEKPRRGWLTLQGISGPIPATGLIVLAGYLAARGWQWPFIVYTAALPLCLAAAVWLYEPPRSNAAVVEATAAAALAPAAAPFPYRTMVAVCLLTALTCTIYFVEPVHFSLVLKALGVSDPKSIGWIVAIPSIGVPLGAVIFRFTAGTKVSLQFLLLFLLEGIGLIIIGVATDYRTALAGAFVQQLGNGLIFPVLTFWAQNSFSQAHRGRGMGGWSSAFFAAQFFSPMVVAGVGHLLSGGLQTAFIAIGVVSLACGAVALVRGGGRRATPAGSAPPNR